MSETPGAAESAGREDGTATHELVLPTTETHELVLCCRRCRQPLLRPSNTVEHEQSRHNFSFRRQAKERGQHGGGAGEVDRSECTSFFLEEPLQWMKVIGRHGWVRAAAARRRRSPLRGRRARAPSQDASSDVEGKLNCPKCGTRVGVLKWAGAQCSCECRLRGSVGARRTELASPWITLPPTGLPCVGPLMNRRRRHVG
jgi:hypothetical protein